MFRVAFPHPDPACQCPQTPGIRVGPVQRHMLFNSSAGECLVEALQITQVFGALNVRLSDAAAAPGTVGQGADG